MIDDDAALIAAVCHGSDLAFNQIVDRHQQAVRAFVRGLVRSRGDADDIAQEAFLSAWQHARSYKGSGSVRSWLFSIAWRKAMDALRSSSRGRRRDAAYHEIAADDMVSGTAPEDAVAVEQALAILPVDQRAAVVLCLGLGLSHGEAAAVLELPLGTVKSHVLRGRERLQTALGRKS
jgi:RNA polymerase sigma-70 factor, ECF subfamily